MDKGLISESLDIGADCCQLLLYLFVPPVDVIHAVDYRFSARRKARKHQRSRRAQIRRLEPRSHQFAVPFYDRLPPVDVYSRAHAKQLRSVHETVLKNSLGYD